MRITPPTIRPLLPGDEAKIEAFFARLTPEQVRQRFGHAMRELPPEWLHQWCNPDDRTHVAWGLFSTAPDQFTTQLHGLSQVFVGSQFNQAEWAIVMESSWSGRGWGTRLGHRMLSWLQGVGIRDIVVQTAPDNQAMRHLARRLGFISRPSPDPMELHLHYDPAAPAPGLAPRPTLLSMAT